MSALGVSNITLVALRHLQRDIINLYHEPDLEKIA